MPAINRADRKYLVLGIHGEGVRTVEGNVARVRMYIGDEQVDEDFPLPKALTVEEQLDTLVQTRIAELNADYVLGQGVKKAEDNQ